MILSPSFPSADLADHLSFPFPLVPCVGIQQLQNCIHFFFGQSTICIVAARPGPMVNGAGDVAMAFPVIPFAHRTMDYADYAHLTLRKYHP
jgi:hypothetical protein